MLAFCSHLYVFPVLQHNWVLKQIILRSLCLFLFSYFMYILYMVPLKLHWKFITFGLLSSNFVLGMIK